MACPYAPCPSDTFEYPHQGFDAVEVWDGQWASDLPWNADNESALAEVRHPDGRLAALSNPVTLV
ncbi:hypothetical protein [Solwaraspora sp. WMMD792]|uniref:hypothetical protein n=1 Tax=Solwaraspora sp. WMMD792 TaxID=3016099 RepID=UPI002415DEAE|nr:hypothetical protein [Solwaraspora sp. WMMD792]MDG4772453.1 hypothetical protein [Solwaraspora sp. WMMD792]